MKTMTLYIPEKPITSYKEMIKRGYAYAGTTMEERLGKDGNCGNCGNNEWVLASKKVRDDGGKQYIICLNCGGITHF